MAEKVSMMLVLFRWEEDEGGQGGELMGCGNEAYLIDDRNVVGAVFP